MTAVDRPGDDVHLFILDDEGLLYFGGSTNHWEGNCRPFDEIDFEARPWVPHSGWPFGRAALVPYYRRAEAICETGPFDYGDSAWSGEGTDAPPGGRRPVSRRIAPAGSRSPGRPSATAWPAARAAAACSRVSA